MSGHPNPDQQRVVVKLMESPHWEVMTCEFFMKKEGDSCLIDGK